ncbi:T6SS protein Cts1T [Hafnia alvei]|uniref:T6SS protein Cts1T n=1 Tax=Hafnia alvei TaxID=569 RepID=A0ABD7Q5E9_HAFAL|nr:T6SS protein Cts1T [Hafnia alvei]TBL68528.1 T6SS protein Cts1T [Hafnia alvei]
MPMRLFLLVDETQMGLFRRFGKMKREVHSIITRQILPNIGLSLTSDCLSERYPWCFIISRASFRKRRFYAGAFTLLTGEHGEQFLVVIFSSVSYSWLQKNMQTEFPLTFWASRVLNTVRNNDAVSKDWQSLWVWLKKLQVAYSPWEFLLKPIWHFKNQSQMLLREGSREDYNIRRSDGVEVMPWTDWPGCTEHQLNIWSWRQSRHGKILDSLRVPLQRAEATSPDASF